MARWVSSGACRSRRRLIRRPPEGLSPRDLRATAPAPMARTARSRRGADSAEEAALPPVPAPRAGHRLPSRPRALPGTVARDPAPRRRLRTAARRRSSEWERWVRTLFEANSKGGNAASRAGGAARLPIVELTAATTLPRRPALLER